ncbi:nitroreductase family protein [Ornithinibacillus contaminans]|uniref:nitroreductase family protein n=1 Tax=Ornithinibacillus contaminans TaxID=694055 RepID=UPI00064DC04D|nr:nitroreductase family protein [Ornithinibacillus contaminans]
MKELQDYRTADYEIDPIYLKRWSPRSFLEKDVPEQVLYSLFEAARWAPSAANVQPWRFVVARTVVDRERFLTFINDGNKAWCRKAPVLVAVISKAVEERFGGKNPSHAFDTGTAWGFLALEAARKGLVTHAMGGFNRQEAKKLLQIPEGFDVQAIVAIGYQGDKAELNETLQEREIPSNRHRVEDFTFEGLFPNE